MTFKHFKIPWANSLAALSIGRPDLDWNEDHQEYIKRTKSWSGGVGNFGPMKVLRDVTRIRLSICNNFRMIPFIDIFKCIPSDSIIIISHAPNKVIGEYPLRQNERIGGKFLNNHIKFNDNTRGEIYKIPDNPTDFVIMEFLSMFHNSEMILTNTFADVIVIKKQDTFQYKISLDRGDVQKNGTAWGPAILETSIKADL